MCVFVTTTQRTCAKGIGVNWDPWRTCEGHNANYRLEPPPFGISVCWFHLAHLQNESHHLDTNQEINCYCYCSGGTIYWHICTHFLVCVYSEQSCAWVKINVDLWCLLKTPWISVIDKILVIIYLITVPRQLSAHSVGFAGNCGKAWSIPPWNDVLHYCTLLLAQETFMRVQHVNMKFWLQIRLIQKYELTTEPFVCICLSVPLSLLKHVFISLLCFNSGHNSNHPAYCRECVLQQWNKQGCATAALRGMDKMAEK